MSEARFDANAVPAAFLEDYEALLHAGGAVETSRDFLVVSGPDAVGYLQGQCSQDISGLEVGFSSDALVLEPQGKLDALVRITRIGPEMLLVDVAGGYGEDLMARLERFKLRVKADIERLHWRTISLRGPQVAKAEIDPSSNVQPFRADSSGLDVGTAIELDYSWNGLRGVDLVGEDPHPPRSVRGCSAAALEVLRIEQGIPEMGKELDHRTIPAEAGLLERCVSFTKGCYTGQELVARLDARGNRVARRLRGIVIEAGEPSVPVGSAVKVGEKVVGAITSVGWSPSLGATVALGYLHREVVPPCRVEVLIPAAPAPAVSASTTQATAVLSGEARELPLVS